MPRPSRALPVVAWLGPFALAAAFVGLAAWSWGKWTDVHIDFGSELYIPWQIREGGALYRDIAHRNGPLSHYGNALLFGLFGTSIRTLVLANLAILAGLCAMLYALFRRACGPGIATATGLVFLGVFAFAQYVGIGNFNYVTPYHHAQTHGLVHSVGMILCLAAAVRRASAARCAAAGLCLGLALLTKAEVAAPAMATAALAGVLVLGHASTRGRRASLALAFAAAALLPGALFAAALSAQMPTAQAVGGVLGNWRHLGGGLLADAFYLEGAGLTRAPQNLATALAMLSGLALAFAAALGIDRLRPLALRRRGWNVAAGVLVFCVLVATEGLVPWAKLARALPFTALIALVALAISGHRALDRPGWRETRAPLLLWSCFSLLLLGKLLLNVRFGQYGFVLAMPATLLLVATLLELPKRLCGPRPDAGGLARALAAGSVAAGVVFFLQWSDGLYARSQVAVGSGGDRILVSDPRGTAVNRALRELGKHMPPQATLLVLPEGVSLNYWLRRRNPTPYLLYLPTEFEAFGGETVMLESLRRAPPDFVALVHRRSEEFGVGPFGEDPRNGQQILAWVRKHYRRLGRIGAEPFGQQFGIVLLERDESGSP